MITCWYECNNSKQMSKRYTKNLCPFCRPDCAVALVDWVLLRLRPCVDYWSVHYVLWEQSSSHVTSFVCSGSLFQMWMCCKGGHYRGFLIYAHYRSAQTSFIGAWGGGSNKIRCRIGFRRCQIRIRLVPA